MKKFLLFSLLLFVSLSALPFPRKVLSGKGTPAMVEADDREIAGKIGETSGKTVRRFLLLGCDRAASLTDAILLASLNTATGDLRLLQIPRDTYANYTARDYRKLNGALNALGQDGMKALLSRTLGVKIHYVAAIDLEGVTALVNAVGGVDVEIPQDMDYSDPAQNLEIHFRKGFRHLDGNDAISFVRFRSGYVNADLGRMDAQKVFLRAFAAKCADLNEAGYLRLFFAVLPYMRTDLPVQEAILISGALKNCNFAEIPMQTAPGEAVRGSSGAWYYSVNRAGMIRAVNELLQPTEPVDERSMDPERVFDCAENPHFHRIYLAPDPEKGG